MPGPHPPLPPGSLAPTLILPGDTLDHLQGGIEVPYEVLRADILTDPNTYKRATEDLWDADYNAMAKSDPDEEKRASALREAITAPIVRPREETPRDPFDRIENEKKLITAWHEVLKATALSNFDAWANEKPAGAGATRLEITVEEIGDLLKEDPDLIQTMRADILHITGHKEVWRTTSTVPVETYITSGGAPDAQALEVGGVKERDLTPVQRAQLEAKQAQVEAYNLRSERLPHIGEEGDPHLRANEATREHYKALAAEARAMRHSSEDERRVHNIKIFMTSLAAHEGYDDHNGKTRDDILKAYSTEIATSKSEADAAATGAYYALHEWLTAKVDDQPAEKEYAVDVPLEKLRNQVKDLIAHEPNPRHSQHAAWEEQFRIVNERYLNIAYRKARAVIRMSETYAGRFSDPGLKADDAYMIIHKGRRLSLTKDGLGVKMTDEVGEDIVLYEGGVTERKVTEGRKTVTKYFGPDNKPIDALEDQPDYMVIPRSKEGQTRMRRVLGKIGLSRQVVEPVLTPAERQYELRRQRAIFDSLRFDPGGYEMRPQDPRICQDTLAAGKQIIKTITDYLAETPVDAATGARTSVYLMQAVRTVGRIEALAVDEEKERYESRLLPDESVVTRFEGHTVRIMPDGACMYINETPDGRRVVDPEKRFDRKYNRIPARSTP